MAEEDPALVRRGPARVHIYGGGIAGLTVAHELARRGFRVRVYEPAQEYDEMGRPESGPSGASDGYRDSAVGGRARSQRVRVNKGAPGNFPGIGQLTTHEAYRFTYDYTGDWRGANCSLQPESVLEFLAQGDLLPASRFPGILLIRAPPGREDEITPTRHAAARGLQDALTGGYPAGLLPIGASPLEPERVINVGSEEEAFAQRLGAPFPPMEDRDALLLEVVQFLPGEHRFRFFPSASRHLFATLEETPLLDDAGQPTGRRVADNLVPVRVQTLTARPADGAAPEAVRSTLRLWRYLCTCSERRKAECERLSWREYLGGADAKPGPRGGAYGEDVGLDVDWSDARTVGNALAQRYLDTPRPRERTDSTLNGPATPAWFRPWRRYLAEHLRVEFFRGELTRFAFEEGRVVPYVTGTYEMELGEWEEKPDTGAWVVFEYTKEPVDYYVVATDAVTAEQVTKDLSPIGVVAGLRGFTSRIPANPRGSEKERRRPHRGLPGQVPWDRFHTRTGIQLFFSTSVRLAGGCLHLADTPWALTVLDSQQYQAVPPTLARDGFTSMLSVDIGRWHVSAPGVMQPSQCSRHELAREVWRQLRAVLPLPEPAWYHVDRFIRFEPDPRIRAERPVKNLAPYLVPVVGDWERRPGTEPWDPWGPDLPARPAAEPSRALWQAEHGGYPVHWGQLLFAGSYLRTFTRTPSMESANESARHAVNALLDHFVARSGPPRTDAGSRTEPSVLASGSQASRPVPAAGLAALTTPVGEYCRIWDPEKYELRELEPLRELDARLFAAGLPHVWEVLQLEPLALPLLTTEPADDARALRSFLERVRGPLEAMVDIV